MDVFVGNILDIHKTPIHRSQGIRNYSSLETHTMLILLLNSVLNTKPRLILILKAQSTETLTTTILTIAIIIKNVQHRTNALLKHAIQMIDYQHCIYPLKPDSWWTSRWRLARRPSTRDPDQIHSPLFPCPVSHSRDHLKVHFTGKADVYVTYLLLKVGYRSLFGDNGRMVPTSLL